MPNIRKGLMGAAGSGGAGNTVYMWGYGTHGTLAQGSGDKTNKSSPVLVLGIAPVDITTLGNSGFGLQANGTLYSWGLNTSGSLGRNLAGSGSYSSGGGTDAFVAVTGVQNFAKLAEGSGGSGLHAIKTDGTLWGWGANSFGQIGDGSTVEKSAPVQIGSLTDWGGSKIRSTTQFTQALKSDGTLWSWGSNTGGQLCDGTTTDRSSPVQIVTGVKDFQNRHAGGMLIKTDGTLWTWGTGSSGQLGNGTTPGFGIGQSSPGQVGSLTTWSLCGATYKNCIAVKTDNKLWAWGDGSNSYCPWGNTTTYNSPIQIGSLTDWLTPGALSNNNTAGCVKTDGTLWMWGRNTQNIMQDASATAKFSSPVQVGTQTHYSADLSKFVLSSGGSNLTRIALA